VSMCASKRYSKTESARKKWRETEENVDTKGSGIQ